MEKLNILVVGGTGFIGKTLSRALMSAGYTVAVMSRRLSRNFTFKPEINFIQADVTVSGHWQKLVSDFDVVVNLAGISIFRHWTGKGKQEILNSRIFATRNIIDTFKMHKGKVKQFFGVSGVGYYGFHGDEVLDENNPAGADFLAQVAELWEEETKHVSELDIRAVICRFGHVLGIRGGVLPKLTTLAKLHLASQWGSGNQWISWVHEDDLARAILFLIENPAIIGPVNITSPNPVRNREMMQLLAKTVRKRVLVPPIPKTILQLITGEFASVFVNGQRVTPRKLLSQGFNFKYHNLQAAVDALLHSQDNI